MWISEDSHQKWVLSYNMGLREQTQVRDWQQLPLLAGLPPLASVKEGTLAELVTFLNTITNT